MSSTGRLSVKKMGAMRITAYAEFSAMKRRCCVFRGQAVLVGCSHGAWAANAAWDGASRHTVGLRLALFPL